VKPARRRRPIGRIVVLVLVVLWSAAPIYAGLTTSLSRRIDIQRTPAQWWPSPVTGAAYSELAPGGKSSTPAAQSFFDSLLHSVVLTGVSSIVILVISVLAGYAFSRLLFPGRKLIMGIVVGTLVIPLFALVVPLFRMYAAWRLTNTMTGLVLLYTVAYLPLGIWLFYNYVRQLPREPEEAALVDGCTRVQALLWVVIPQMRAGIAALAAILMISTWGEFLIPLIFSTTASTEPLTVTIADFVGKYTVNVPLMMAAGILALIPPAVLALAVNRNIRGMLSGSSH
jgi:multiple sugar transport system permease protein